MLKLQKQIHKLINEDLPSKVGQELKKELESLAILRDEREEQDNTIKELQKDLNLVRKELKEHQSLDDKRENLRVRERAIEEGERNMKIAELKYQLQAEKDKTTHAVNINNQLVRNVEYRSDVMGSRTVRDDNGYTTNEPYNEDRKQTAE